VLCDGGQRATISSTWMAASHDHRVGLGPLMRHAPKHTRASPNPVGTYSTGRLSLGLRDPSFRDPFSRLKCPSPFPPSRRSIDVAQAKALLRSEQKLPSSPLPPPPADAASSNMDMDPEPQPQPPPQSMPPPPPTQLLQQPAHYLHHAQSHQALPGKEGSHTLIPTTGTLLDPPA
jgi:hypothetical protein